MIRTSKTQQKMRRVGALVVLVILLGNLGCVQRGAAQGSMTRKASFEEASRLNQVVESLYKEGKFQEAVPLAEQSLALREKALGPMHPDVAESLNNLAALYQAQDAYARAEPLYVRALAIREKAL